MAQFDQAARQAAKLDPPGFFHWLFAEPDPPLTFRAWLDTRRLVFPGEPDRTSDTVAELDNRDDPGRRFGLVVEFQTEPAGDMAERLALYGLQLRLEVRPEPGRSDKYPVGLAVVNLTGSPPPAGLDIPLPGAPGCGLRVWPLQRNLADVDAQATLADIAAGRTARALLAWIPLMRGGSLPGIITEWKRLAELEPDAALRATYAGLALVFAELTRGLLERQKGLEGWEMRESQVIEGWKREGKREGILEDARKAVAAGAAAFPHPRPG